MDDQNLTGNGGNALTLSLPQKEGKAGYVLSFLMARSEMMQIIKSMTRVDDPRIVNAAKLLIGFVDEETYRRDLFKRFNDRISEINKGSETALEKQHLILDEALFVVGELTSYFDRAVGLSHRLEVSML